MSFTLIKTISGISANPAFAACVGPTVFQSMPDHQVVARVRMTLRTVSAFARRVSVSFFSVFNFSTRRTRKAAIARFAVSVHDLADGRIFVSVWAKLRAVGFWWGDRLRWDDRQRPGACVNNKPHFQISPPPILLHGNRLEMVGPDTVTDKAQVIDLKAFGDLANLILIGKAVSRRLRPPFTVLNRKSSIAVISSAANPKPTAGSVRDNANPKTSWYQVVIHRGIITQLQENCCA